jgi:hypothetical protein
MLVTIADRELLVQGASGQRPCSQLFTGSIIELLELCVASEMRAEGSKHAASGEATRFRRVVLHPFEIDCAEVSPAPTKSAAIAKSIVNKFSEVV